MYCATNPWQTYRQNATKTATPGQLVLMLYDGALRFLETGLVGFENHDPLRLNETVNNNIQRAQAILNELSLSLNMKAGGEFADRMRGLYEYMDRRLQESNIAKEKAGIEEVIRHLTVLRDAWREMLNAGGESGVQSDDGNSVPLSSAALV